MHVIRFQKSYGDAERVLGNVIANRGPAQQGLIATKLESPDEAELKRSLRGLKAAKLDLLQLPARVPPGWVFPRTVIAAFCGTSIVLR